MTHVVIYHYSEETDCQLIRIGKCDEEEISLIEALLECVDEHYRNLCYTPHHVALIQGSTKQSVLARAERRAEKREETVSSVTKGPLVIEDLGLGTELLVDGGMKLLPKSYKKMINTLLCYENVEVGEMIFPDYEDYLYGDQDFERDTDFDSENESHISDTASQTSENETEYGSDTEKELDDDDEE